jgi:benzoyl-CoA reductase/2-hydroxyglutaryl-CoA dehydratase subunit BcrC/BadD/HgdB
MFRAESDLNKLIDLLEKKKRLLKEFLRLTKYQTEFIKNEDIKKMDNLLKSKEKRIIKINRFDREFIEGYEELKERYGVEKPEELKVNRILLQEFRNITKEIVDLTGFIYQLDINNSNIMRDNFVKLKIRLMDIRKGKKARAGYKNSLQQTGGVFIDKREKK